MTDKPSTTPAAALIERRDRRSAFELVRGAVLYGQLHCTYGSRVEVIESLAARGHLWLRMEAGPGALWYLDQGQGAAHLSLEQTKELRAVLDVAIAESERLWVTDV